MSGPWPKIPVPLLLRPKYHCVMARVIVTARRPVTAKPRRLSYFIKTIFLLSPDAKNIKSGHRGHCVTASDLRSPLAHIQ